MKVIIKDYVEAAKVSRTLIHQFIGYSDEKTCSGNIETCPNDECLVCGERECPHGEPLHFHHDGCPACVFDEEKESENGNQNT